MNKINLSAAFNNQTGYSIASVNIGMQLSELGCDLTLFPIGGITQEKNIYEWVINNSIKKYCDYNAKGLKIWHQHQMYDFPICSERIGFPIFELNKFTDRELHSLNSVDRLVVCSNWAKEICFNNGFPIYDKTSVCPLGVNSKIFSVRDKPQTDKYIFINLGKWEVRKGHDILVEIFNKAFTKNDNVELWMLPNNPFLTKEQEKEWLKLYKDSPLGYKIKIFPPLSTHEDVSNFICRADCAIFPHRAEGWGMENLECMACNLPVITTNYSGTTEYSNKKNSFLVDITELESAQDGIWFNGQGEWAKISNKEIDQFVDYMRHCYQNRINSNPGGVVTGKLYSWKNSARTLRDIIFDL